MRAISIVIFWAALATFAHGQPYGNKLVGETEDGRHIYEHGVEADAHAIGRLNKEVADLRATVAKLKAAIEAKPTARPKATTIGNSPLVEYPKCHECNGHGKYSLHTAGRDMEMRCPLCKGTGEASEEEKKIVEQLAIEHEKRWTPRQDIQWQGANCPREVLK